MMGKIGMLPVAAIWVLRLKKIIFTPTLKTLGKPWLFFVNRQRINLTGKMMSRHMLFCFFLLDLSTPRLRRMPTKIGELEGVFFFFASGVFQEANQ